MKPNTTIEKTLSGDGYIIEIHFDNKTLLRVKITQPPYIDYQAEIFPVELPNVMMLDVKGHGYSLKRKQ